MELVTWNIQWGLGLDGRVDLERMVKTARAMADFDVLCVQEVADNFPDLDHNDDRDQFAELSRLLPGFTRIEGYGVDLADGNGRRRRFGNAIYCRLPVLSARRHALPWPPEPKRSTMPRVAIEATIQAPFGPLRVTTTHLEYYSDVQRHAQVHRLRMLHDEACQRAMMPAPTMGDSNATFKPTPQTTAAILVGDFNFPPENPAYEEIRRPLDGGGPAYRDAWSLVHGDAPHPPTFCLHDRSYSEKPYCCDFAFVSADLAPRVRGIEANLETKDSDHQPVVVKIEG